MQISILAPLILCCCHINALISLNNDFLIFILNASVNGDNVWPENERLDELGKTVRSFFLLSQFHKPHIKPGLNLASYNYLSLGPSSTFVDFCLIADWWRSRHLPIRGTQIVPPLGNLAGGDPGELQNCKCSRTWNMNWEQKQKHLG